MFQKRKQTGSVRINVTLMPVRVTIVAVGNGVYYMFWGRVFNLSMQHAMHMRNIVIYGL